MHWTESDLRINSVGTVLCEPEWQWNSRALNDYDLWYVWAGRGTIQLAGQSWDVSPGSCFCIRPGEQPRARHDPRHRLGVCYIHFDFVSEPDEPPPRQVRLGEVDLFERLLKHVVSLHVSGSEMGRRSAVLHLRGVLADLAVAAEQPRLSGTAREHHDAIRAAARHIRENPGELFSIEQLAERAAYSADHFSRLFRQIMGQTPKEFCITVRMERARTLLQESSLGIEQIAVALGYADVFFFSRQFKQRTGKSPTQWRKAV